MESQDHRPRTQRRPWTRHAWLLTGTVLSFFAVHSALDIPLAAWLFPLFLIYFARTGRTLPAVLWVWAAALLGAVFWIWRAEVLSPPMLLIAVLLGTVQTVPFLIDRLAAPRLEPWSALTSTLVFPAAKVVTEYALASLSPLGGIYGILGTTQHDNLALIQTASVTGVYGVSFLVAWFAAVGAHALLWSSGPRRIPRPVVVYACVLGCVLSAGGARLALAPPDSDTVRVAGVSLSERSWDEKVSPAFERFDSLEEIVTSDPAKVRRTFAPINRELLDLSAREARAGAEVIVWSESAGFTLEKNRDRFLRDVQDVAREHGVYIEAGVSVYTEQAPNIRNQAILVTPAGKTAWIYDKSHPIPVLEPYDAGPGELPVEDTPFGRLSTAICYDVDFPGTMRQGAERGADIMLLPSNEWEGIKKLHAERALFRAVEGGYSLVRPVSRGHSTVTDHQGRALATSDYFDTNGDPMVASVPAKGVTTVYGRIGDTFAWLCITATVVLSACAVARRRHDRW